MTKTVTTTLLSSLLLLLFGYTAFSKLGSLAAFRATLDRTPFISPGAALLAPAIPLAELGIVLLLFFKRTRLYGLYASAGLLALFTAYLAAMLLFAPHLPCSCGGVISGMSWKAHLGMNLGFIGLAVLAIRGYE